MTTHRSADADGLTARASARPGATVPRVVRRPLQLHVSRADEHRWITPLAVVGLALAAALAVLGLPPLDLQGPLHPFGIMDPLCGGTRATRLAVRGELAASWRYNPLGVVVVAGALAVVARWAVGRSTGRWLTVRVTSRRTVTWLVLLATAALAVRQQLHADLLMAG